MSERRDIVIEVDADTRKARSAINDVFRIGRDAMNLAEDFGIKIDDQTKKLFNTLDDIRRSIMDLIRLASVLGGSRVGGIAGGAAGVGGFTGSASMIGMGAIAGGAISIGAGISAEEKFYTKQGATPEQARNLTYAGGYLTAMGAGAIDIVANGWVALLRALGFGGP